MRKGFKTLHIRVRHRFLYLPRVVYRAATVNYVAVAVDHAAAVAATEAAEHAAVAAEDNAAANYADNVPILAGNGALGNADNVGLVTDNAITVPASKFKKIMNKLKYILPMLTIAAVPVWLLGGLSGWGAVSPVGLNVC